MMRLAAIFLLAASTAQAGTFTPPKGCTAYLTVQSAGCKVEHHWTCAADPDGDKWQGEMNQYGQLTYMGKVDDEAQWIDSYYIESDTREQLISPAKDPANLTNLLAQGEDTYDFTLDTPTGVMRVEGYDRIVERNLLIDTEVLHRTEYQLRITDAEGNLTFSSEGNEYVSEIYRMFFGGTGRVTGPDAPYRYKDDPIEFFYPGEPGFLDNTPRYGCDALSAQAVIK